MKKILFIILSPVLLCFLLFKVEDISVFQTDTTLKQQPTSLATNISVKSSSEQIGLMNNNSGVKDKFDVKERKNVVNHALTLLGKPYIYGGNSPEGFDCSGFTTYVFDQIGISIKRSSGLQSTEGDGVERKHAAPGDLIIFTGTDKSVREPGHVGIVISEPGDTLEFIHSSSSRRESGVKISQVEGSGYEDRFLEIRRVL
jgi:cell wall-associated NlpC family hydrolase